MPTPANQALAQSSASVQAGADLVEAVLEEHIEKGATRVHLMDYQGSGLDRFTPGTGFLPQGTTIPVLQEVKRRYVAAGWSVRIMSDQRDGTGITIDAREQA